MSNPSAISTSDLERIRACDHVVLFHDDADGYGSAAALMSAFPELMFAPVVVNYHYPSTFELFDGPALTDKHVYIVDFSAPGSKDGALARIEALHAKAASLQVIDHHPVTEGMTHLPYVHYTPGVAGCKATWEFYHKGEPLPELLRYIAMYDLWEHYGTGVSGEERTHCDAIQLGIEASWMLRNSIDNWNRWNTALASCGDWLRLGCALVGYRDKLIAELCNPKNKHVVMRDVCGHRVPTVISPNWPNEIAHWLLVGFPEAPFVMVGKHIEQGDTALVKWSVRARKGFDTREISNRFGGGGHEVASSFTVNCPLMFTKGATEGAK
jgi:hypothetical protein